MPKGLSGKIKMDADKNNSLAKQEPTSIEEEPAVDTSATSKSKAADLPAKVVPDAPDGQLPKAKPRKSPSWLWWTVAILFALFYTWDLFEALSNLFAFSDQLNRTNEYKALNGLNTVAIPWVPLVVNVALPIVVYFLSLFVSRKRNVGVLAIVLLCGLGVVAAGSLSLAELVGLLAR